MICLDKDGGFSIVIIVYIYYIYFFI